MRLLFRSFVAASLLTAGACASTNSESTVAPPVAPTDAAPDDAEPIDASPTSCRVGPDVVGAVAGLDAEIEKIVADQHVPGVSVAVVKNGKTAFAKGYGQRTRAGDKQTARTVHLLMSASKPITAVAIMQLVEANKLSLDDDVDKILAPLSIRNPKFPTVPITVRALLTHTSSIVDAEPYWDESFYTKGDPRVSTKDFVAGYFTPGASNFGGPARFRDEKPGEMSCYSNVGVGVLSLVIEAVSKESFSDYTKKHIFDVLGMKDSSFLLRDHCDPDCLVENLAYANGKFVLDHYGAEGQPENHPELASGMLRSTAVDMARWIAALAGDGALDGVRILSAASMAELRRRQLADTLPSCDARTTAGNQALLAYYSKDAVAEYFGHAGGGKGVATDIFFRTGDKIGFVVLASAADEGWMNDIEIALLRAADTLP